MSSVVSSTRRIPSQIPTFSPTRQVWAGAVHEARPRTIYFDASIVCTTSLVVHTALAMYLKFTRAAA